MSTEQMLLPDEDEHSARFWEGCRRGELLVQACGDCGRLRFPPRPMCPACNSLQSEWRPLSGRGRIWSWVVVHPPMLAAYADFAPYPVVVVELDEDQQLRMVGNVVATEGAAINSVDPSTLIVGAPLQVIFDRIRQDVMLPRWLLVSDVADEPLRPSTQEV